MLWHALWNERVNNNKQKTKAIFRCTMDGIKKLFSQTYFYSIIHFCCNKSSNAIVNNIKKNNFKRFVVVRILLSASKDKSTKRKRGLLFSEVFLIIWKQLIIEYLYSYIYFILCLGTYIYVIKFYQYYIEDPKMS